MGRDSISRRHILDLLSNKAEQEGKEQVAAESKSGAFPRQEFCLCYAHTSFSVYLQVSFSLLGQFNWQLLLILSPIIVTSTW